MFDTDAIFEWVLGNLYVVGGAVGAALLITLAILLLMVRRRKQEPPSIESAFGPPRHDATAQGYVDLDQVGGTGLPSSFELDDAPGPPSGSASGSTPGSDSSPVPPPSDLLSELEEPPPSEGAPSPLRPIATAAVTAASPFANSPARATIAAGGDHVRKVIAGLLEGRGDFSGPEMRRLELLRPEKILQAIDELEPTISGRNKGPALARLARIRSHAELLATGAAIPHTEVPSEAIQVADTALPDPPEWQGPAVEPETEQPWQEAAAEPMGEDPTVGETWTEPVIEAPQDVPTEASPWQEHFEERPPEQQEEQPEVLDWQEPITEPPAETPMAPEWEEPIADPPLESPAEPVWQEGLPDEGQEHAASWQDSLALPPTEAIEPTPDDVAPEAGSTPPSEPVFQRSAPRNDSHWLPTAPVVLPAPADEVQEEGQDEGQDEAQDEARDEALESPVAQPSDAEPAPAEPFFETPAEPAEEWVAPSEPASVAESFLGAPDKSHWEPFEAAIDQPAREVEAYEDPGQVAATWNIHDDVVSNTGVPSSSEHPGVGGGSEPELEARLIGRSDSGIEEERHALEQQDAALMEPRDVTLEPLELTIETAEHVFALDATEQADALAFLSSDELARVFATATDKRLKLSVIDLLSHQETSEAMNALDACLDDPDPEVRLYALDAAERLLGDA